MEKRGAIAISQILILMIAIFAISYLINEVAVVSADPVGAGSDVGATVSATGTPTNPNVHGLAGDALYEIAPRFANSAAGFSTSGIVQGAYWAAIVYGIVKFVGPMFGLESGTVDAAATALAAGVFAGQAAYSLFGAGGYFAGALPALGLSTALTGLAATGIGIVIAVIVFIMVYSSMKIKIVEFQCQPWDATTGGSNCEKCNTQGLPCSAYQCRSLGQACELLNPGTENEKCTWVNKNDVDPPIIRPLKAALLDGYEYTPDNTISPPDKGVIVLNKESSEGCAKAFTPLSFGIELDEPAKCKIDYIRKNSFEDMGFFFGTSSLFRYNHTQIMALPGPESLEAINLTLQNDGEFELYTRCQDANGNSNVANFVFKVCVEKGPDTTPPLIVSTSLLNGMPVAYEQTSIDLELYINEPAECKWSHLDQDYDDMETTMSCSLSVEEMNARMLYTCKTTLTGLKNNFENKFYFRCKDQPLKTTDRNVNMQSHEFILIGTQPLVIDEVEPNGTISDSTDVIQVTLKAETSAGYNEGESICYYSFSGEDDYIAFFETNSYKHSQDLWLSQGNYKYFIKCIDLGGNADTREVNFFVESDTTAPVIVRAYHDEPYLKIVTNEEAECVYDTISCSYLFADGTSISTSNGLEHFTDWNTKTNLYIKCQDEYGNDPQPSNECSIRVRAYEV